MIKRFFFIIFLCCNVATAQELVEIIAMHNSMEETSGLEYFNGNLITHNDSGGAAELYEFDLNGNLLAIHPVVNAKNKDWEDITQDQKYIYIGDHGNNFASREGLKIYKTQWNGKHFKSIGKIRYRYGHQKNFKKRGMNAFDAEALATAGEQLLLFSKNRKTKNTEVYKIPKEPGEYVIYPKTSVPVNALITGADFNADLKILAMVGYSFDGMQFIYRVRNFDPEQLNFENIEKAELPRKGAQIEAIKVIDDQHFWITSEERKAYGKPELMRVEWK